MLQLETSSRLRTTSMRQVDGQGLTIQPLFMPPVMDTQTASNFLQKQRLVALPQRAAQLFWALLNGYDACAEILYPKEHKICDNKQQTPLMAAAAGGSTLFVSRMVEAGLFTDSIDVNWETALMKAADANRPECVEILMLKTNDLRKQQTRA